MSTLVLDMSVVRAAPKGCLKSFRKKGIDFLLTDVLLQEIGTLGMRDTGSALVSRGTNNSSMIDAAFRKAIQECGNTWVDSVTALRWEIEHGESVRERRTWQINSPPCATTFPPDVMELSRERERCWGQLLSFAQVM